MKVELGAAVFVSSLCPFSATAAYPAPTVASVVSASILPYQAALEGLKSVYRGVLIEFDMERDTEKALTAMRRVKELDPVAVVVVGSEALRVARKEITNIPLVFLMSLDPDLETETRPNMAGISLEVLPEEQLALLKRVAPEVSTVGVVYDPANTGGLVSKISTAAGKKRITLEAIPVGNTTEALMALRELAGRVDALMMVPDVTTATDKCFDLMLLLSLRKKIPLLALSPKYVNRGALLAPVVDYRDIGRQAGGVLVQIINGKNPEELGYLSPRRVLFALNLKTAKKIGIHVSQSLVAQAANVYK